MVTVVVDEDVKDITGLGVFRGPCLFYAAYREEQRDEIH